ncbi:MAG: DUF4240 domain-containing protein [Promethearchaeota archaeon]
MDLKTFWNLIDDCRERHKKEDDDEFIDDLTTNLIGYSKQDIVDFERLLRKRILEAENYKIVALHHIIFGVCD